MYPGPSSAYEPIVNSHWTRDLDGNFISTIGHIQSLPSDADTADLENLESVPLPPDTTPPPPPLMRTAQLSSLSSSGGTSGRTSRMGTPMRKSKSESLEEYALLKEPPGDWIREKTQNSPSSVARARRQLSELLSQHQSRQSSPPPQFFPDEPLFSSPLSSSSLELIIPPSSEMPTKPHTFSPSQRKPPSATPRGPPLNPRMHHGMPFEPQSTSSPPRGTGRSPPQTKKPSSGMHDPLSNSTSHPPRSQANPQQSLVRSRGVPSTQVHAFPPPQDTQVPVDLLHLYDPGSDGQRASMSDSRYRPTTSKGHDRSQEPPRRHQNPPPARADSTSHASPPPQWPGSGELRLYYPFYAPGYVPYSVAQNVENGYAWDENALRRAGEPTGREKTAPAGRDGTEDADRRASK
ncbi:hypothetical protein C0995_012358, partial [Termitomyces sp. Mi166